jgi:hypothetical protein
MFSSRSESSTKLEATVSSSISSSSVSPPLPTLSSAIGQNIKNSTSVQSKLAFKSKKKSAYSMADGSSSSSQSLFKRCVKINLMRSWLPTFYFVFKKPPFKNSRFVFFLPSFPIITIKSPQDISSIHYTPIIIIDHAH